MTELTFQQASEIIEAATALAATIADMHPFNWEAVTCSEAEAFAALLVATGRHEDADLLIENHSDGDDEGDLHHKDTAA